MALPLALAGCGGIASESEATVDPDCGDTIQIGAPHPYSGPFTEFGTNSYQGMVIAADEINAAGGIEALGGAQLEIVKGDTSTADQAQASSATTKLIEDGAVALVGAWASPLTQAVSTVAEEARIPILTQSWADQLSDRGFQYYFQPPPKASEIGGAAAQYLTEAAEAAGVTFERVAGVGNNDSANVGQITSAVEAFVAGGATAQEPTFFDTGITDPTPIVNQIIGQDPDLILLSGTPADMSLVIGALRDRGVTAAIMGFGGAFVVPSFAENLGADVDGLFAVGAWNADLPLDGVEEAAAAYEDAYGDFMPMEAGESWVDVHLIVQAMEDAGSCDPQDITDALHAMDIDSGPAAAMPGGRVAFDDAGTNESAVPILIQWTDGVPATAWPEEYATIDAVFDN
ncbi:ABC transporter substrate-binding protein [Okibacterium endophyticum]